MTPNKPDMDRIEGLVGRLRKGVPYWTPPGEHLDVPNVSLGDGLMDQAASDLTALISYARELEGAGWQPIETAPKDGTEFLAICATAKNRDMAHYDGYIRVDRWHGGFNGPANFNTVNWPATHWRPLPAPPALSRTQK